jgi:hypothetical protein
MVDCATFNIRPRFDPEGPVAWIAVAHHERGDETWATIGAAESESGALIDLSAQLERKVEELCVLPDEPRHEKKRASLLWSAKSRALLQGTPIVRVL